MGLMDKVMKFLSREAADVKDELGTARDKIDAELTRREEKMNATPSERLDMAKADAAANEDRFDQLAGEVREKYHIDSPAGGGAAAADAVDAVSARGEVDDEVVAAVTGEAGDASAEADDTSSSAPSDEPAAAEDQADTPSGADPTDQPDPVDIDAITEATAEPAPDPFEARMDKYRQGADDLLDELRGEIEAEGGP